MAGVPAEGHIVRPRTRNFGFAWIEEDISADGLRHQWSGLSCSLFGSEMKKCFSMLVGAFARFDQSTSG